MFPIFTSILSLPELNPSNVKFPLNPESIFPKLQTIPLRAQLVRSHNCAQCFSPHEIVSLVETANLSPGGITISPLEILSFPGISTS